MKRLPPEHREVLVQVHILDRTMRETAAGVGIPAGQEPAVGHGVC
ncbi:hypothetical protein [Streptomyces griseoluteus]